MNEAVTLIRNAITHYEKTGDIIESDDLTIALTQHGISIEEYPSAVIASRKTGAARGNISSCLKSNRTEAGGYIWVGAELSWDDAPLWDVVIRTTSSGIHAWFWNEGHVALTYHNGVHVDKREFKDINALSALKKALMEK